MHFEKYGQRFWAVYDEQGDLIAVTVYKKGAREVIRRVSGSITTSTSASHGVANSEGTAIKRSRIVNT